MVKKLYVLAAFQADASRASFDTKQVIIHSIFFLINLVLHVLD